jgi:hypothetical protein
VESVGKDGEHLRTQDRTIFNLAGSKWGEDHSMSAPEELRDVGREFRNRVQAALDQRLEREGSHSADESIEEIERIDN